MLRINQGGLHVHFANAYTIALADLNPDYRSLLREGLVFPDGKPISWFSKLFRHSPPLQQVRGPQFFLDCIGEGRSAGVRHFLLGSTPETLDRLQIQLLKRFPGAKIVGTLSPSFGVRTLEELAADDRLIHEALPDVVWVALGTPKQDFEARRLARNLEIVAVAVGAAFDFAAGTVPEAPRWVRTAGFEWLFRLLTEPRRLWRRYIFGNTRFLIAMCKQLRGRKAS